MHALVPMQCHWSHHAGKLFILVLRDQTRFCRVAKPRHAFKLLDVMRKMWKVNSSWHSGKKNDMGTWFLHTCAWMDTCVAFCTCDNPPWGMRSSGVSVLRAPTRMAACAEVFFWRRFFLSARVCGPNSGAYEGLHVCRSTCACTGLKSSETSSVVLRMDC